VNELVAAHQKNNDRSRERHRNNRVERIRLQKLVDNGEQLVHSDEAKLNELVGAHQKKNNRDRERQQNNRDERYSSDTAEKAKAHETLYAAEKGLVVKWTCDVCKSCSFGTFEDAGLMKNSALSPPRGHAKCATLVHLIPLRKQRLMKHCVLPRRAWSQNGHVMGGKPVHLEHLRMQRLMKNSALSPPCAEAANGGRIYFRSKKVFLIEKGKENESEKSPLSLVSVLK
jgi:hypothetical protein